LTEPSGPADGPAKPLRVVIDARVPDGLSGGVQQWVIGLAHALSQLDVDTEEFLFLVEEGRDQWLTPYLGGRCRLLVNPTTAAAQRAPVLAGRIRGLRAWAGRTFPIIRTVWRRLARRGPPAWTSATHRTVERVGPDVMHFTMQTAFHTRIPNIFQPWDLQHLHLPEFFTSGEREAREAAYRAFCDQAALIITATGWVKRDLIEQYGIAEERIAVVNVPPVTAAYPIPTSAELQAAATRLDLPDRFLFYPAQTWGHKNHLRLFEALAELRGQGMIVPVLCSGHRNERYAELMRAARRLGVAEQVAFLGFLEPMDIQVLYRRARGLIFPSLYEGWGLPIIEAFASDLPVACSNATSLPELVGNAAIVFDPLDSHAIAGAMARLWTDDALVGELVERGRGRLALFDWNRTALIVRAHYRRVAGRPLSTEDVVLLAEPSVV
jgi:glycosyltransferase involved in cell wall biosynthesis